MTEVRELTYEDVGYSNVCEMSHPVGHKVGEREIGKSDDDDVAFCPEFNHLPPQREFLPGRYDGATWRRLPDLVF